MSESPSTSQNGVSLELAPLRRRSDPPCDGRHGTPSPPDNDCAHRRYHKDVDDVIVNDVFKRTRRLEGDGREDTSRGGEIQGIPTELNVLVKQVEEYAVLTGTLPEPTTCVSGDVDDVIIDDFISEDKDVNDNDPLLGEPAPISPVRIARRSPVKRTLDIEEYHFKYDLHPHHEQDEYPESFHRMSLMDEHEYGHRNRGRTHGLSRRVSANVPHYPEHKPHVTRPKHTFGPQMARRAREMQKNRVTMEKERFWKMTSFRQGTRHIKYYWDQATLSPGLETLDYGVRILRSSHTASTDGARGCMGFTSGKHVFQFKFNNLPWGTHCAVGVVKRGAELDLPTYGHLIGKDTLGWGWDIPSKQLIHNGPTGITYPNANLKIPKEIQMTIDVDRGELSFSVEGVDLGVTFTGITTSDSTPLELFPACSCVFAMTEVTIGMQDSSHLVNKTLIKQISHVNIMKHHKANIDHKIASICTLNPELRYLVEVAHGWHIDAGNHMFFAHIPNNPTIVIPKSFPFDVVSQEKLIGIRSRRGVRSGCHCWQVKEELLLTPTVPEFEKDIKHNDMIIGVGTEEFCQLFDGRRQPVEFLQHVTTFWGWRYTSKTLHNFYAKEKLYADQENVPIYIDNGITLVLNQDKAELSFEHGHENLGAAFRDLPKETLYPIVLHVNGTHPVSLLYIDGPPEYLKTVIEDIERTSFTRSEYQTFLGYVPLKITPWISSETVATQRMKQNFSWDRDSMAGTVFSMERKSHCRAICTPPLEPDHDRMDIIRGSMAVSEGTHVWTYTFSNNIGHEDHYLVGVVNELFYTADYTMKANPLCYLWLWDLKDKSLYHGTELVAKYPVYPSTFDVRRYYRFQIGIAMSQRTGFGFSAMAPHIPLDLGLAFSQLPPGKYYPCLVYRSGKLDCKLEYVRGPSAYIESHNKCCCPLQ